MTGDNLVVRWRRPRGLDWVSVLATLAGVGTLLAALGLTTDGFAEWLAGVLVNIGAAVLLVIPIYVLNQRLDKRIERVRVETTSSVKTLSDRVESFEQDVERRIDGIAASVAAQLDQEREQDNAAFTALGDTPSRDVVLEALRRANELGLISQRRGPRVCVSEEWRIYVRVDYDENPDRFFGEEDITFTVEGHAGNSIAVIPWPRDQAVEAVMVRLGRSVQRVTTSAQLDVGAMFATLSQTLAVAQSHPDRRPIWQLCPPQWAVSEDRIITYGKAPHYGAPAVQLAQNQHLSYHISQKPWVDADSLEDAVAVALAFCRQDSDLRP